MAELGVTDWRLLGGPGRFRDSGMIGTPPNDRPDCFWRADLLVAATDLVRRDPRGATAGPRHLRRLRRLRPPRPHPGAPGHALCDRAGRQPDLPRRPRPRMGRAEGLLDGLPAQHRPRGHRGAPGPGRRRRVHRHGSRRHPVRLRRRTRHHGDRRRGLPRQQDGGPARARHPGQRRRGLLRPRRQRGLRGVRHRVLPTRPADPSWAPGTRRGRPISSPGSRSDVGRPRLALARRALLLPLGAPAWA